MTTAQYNPRTNKYFQPKHPLPPEDEAADIDARLEKNREQCINLMSSFKIRCLICFLYSRRSWSSRNTCKRRTVGNPKKKKDRSKLNWNKFHSFKNYWQVLTVWSWFKMPKKKMNMLDFKRGSQLRLDLVAAVLKLKYFFLKANKKKKKHEKTLWC